MAETTPATTEAELELAELKTRLERMRGDRDRVSREAALIREKYHTLLDDFERVEAGGVARKCGKCGWSLERALAASASNVPHEQPVTEEFMHQPCMPLRPDPSAPHPDPVLIAEGCETPDWAQNRIEEPLTIERLMAYSELLRGNGLGAAAAMSEVSELARGEPASLRSASALHLIHQQRRENELLELEAARARDRDSRMSATEELRHINLGQTRAPCVSFNLDNVVITHAAGCVCTDCENYRVSRGDARLNPTRMRMTAPADNAFARAMRETVANMARGHERFIDRLMIYCTECGSSSGHGDNCSRR